MIFLTAVCVALIAGNVALTVAFARERARLVDALMCRNPGEYVALRRAEKAPKARPERDDESPIVPVGL